MAVRFVFDSSEPTALVEGTWTLVFVHRPNDRLDILRVRARRSISAIHRRDAIMENMEAIRRQATTPPLLPGMDHAAELAMTTAARATAPM
jgi:hypothetical protein